jgi:hypothetical protein
MVAIPFPITTAPGQVSQEGAGRLINCYAEPRPNNQGPVWHRAPGLKVFGVDDSLDWVAWSFPPEEFFLVRETPEGSGQYLGGVLVGSNIYAKFGSTFYTIDSAGAFTALTNTDSATAKTHWARNNAATPDVTLVSDGVAKSVSGTSIIAFADSDVGAPQCVCFHDSYFVWGYGTGKLQASGVNAVTVNPLDFTTAESNPDGVSRAWSFRGLLYAAGPATIEVYGDPINATGFPLTRQGYNITPGLITPFAVAGFEPEFGNFPLYVGSDNTVRWLKGSVPEKVSTPDLDFLIASVADKDDLEALCYISRGQAFWQLSCDDWTWVFSLNNGTWHERQSDGLDRSRMSLSIPAFGKWLTGDTVENYMLEIDPDRLNEVEDPLVVTIDSGPVDAFPVRMRVARAEFKISVGVGVALADSATVTDPSVSISWSDDGGATYTSEWTRVLGAQATYDNRVIVRNTGLSGPLGRRWRLSISDEVHFGLMGGDMEAEARVV